MSREEESANKRVPPQQRRKRRRGKRSLVSRPGTAFFGQLREHIRGHVDLGFVELGCEEVCAFVKLDVPAVFASVCVSILRDIDSPEFWFDIASDHVSDFTGLRREAQLDVNTAITPSPVGEYAQHTSLAKSASFGCTFGYEDNRVGIRLVLLPESLPAADGLSATIVAKIEYCTERYGYVTHTVRLLSQSDFARLSAVAAALPVVTEKAAPTALFAWCLANHCADLNAARVVMEDLAELEEINRERLDKRRELMSELKVLEAKIRRVEEEHEKRELQFNQEMVGLQASLGLSQREKGIQISERRDVIEKERERALKRRREAASQIDAVRQKMELVTAPVKLAPCDETLGAYLRLEAKTARGTIPVQSLRRYLATVEVPLEVPIDVIDECVKWRLFGREDGGIPFLVPGGQVE